MPNRLCCLATRSLAVQAAALFLILAGLYTFSIGLRATTNAAISGDEPFYLLTTQSLIDDRNFDLREQYERQSFLVFFDHPDGLWKQSLPDPNGRILSPHEPGLSVLLIPGFALGKLRGAQIGLLLVSAGTFALTFVLVALETGSRVLAFVTTGVVALAAPGFIYATEIYPEMPAAFCLVAALLSSRLRGPVRTAGVVLAVSALAWLGLKYIPLGLVVAVAHVLSLPRRERWSFVALCSLSGGPYLWWHLGVFGALTAYNGNTVYEGAATSTVVESHLAFDGRLYRIWGLFIDRRFGIARWAPIFLAVLPALPLLLARGRVRSGSVILAIIATQLFVATFVAITMMGWWFPGRMLMVVYPLFALVLALAWVRAPPLVRAAGAGAAGYSLLVTAALVQASREGLVRIAVDPFEMEAPLFRVAGVLFPDYRWWSAETVALNAAWVAALALTLLAVTWRALGEHLSVRAGTERAPRNHSSPFPAAAGEGSRGRGRSDRAIVAYSLRFGKLLPSRLHSSVSERTIPAPGDETL